MGVPTSEVGYTPALPRREDHEFHKDMWWHWGKKVYLYSKEFVHQVGKKTIIISGCTVNKK